MQKAEIFTKSLISITMRNQVTNLEMPFHLICKVSISDSFAQVASEVAASSYFMRCGGNGFSIVCLKFVTRNTN